MSNLGLIDSFGVFGFPVFVAQWPRRKRTQMDQQCLCIFVLIGRLLYRLDVLRQHWRVGQIGAQLHPDLLSSVLIFPVWIIVLKKIIRISRVNKISSIADFISLRYGNSRFLGALVTLICMVAILPYVGCSSRRYSRLSMWLPRPKTPVMS
jgi:hypothetical protein